MEVKRCGRLVVNGSLAPWGLLAQDCVTFSEAEIRAEGTLISACPHTL